MPREAAPRQPLCADINGFSLHAAVRIEAQDRKRLEQLCRYITRPALSDELRFHGVLAPNAKLRAPVVPQGPPQAEDSTHRETGAESEVEPVQGRPGRISWACLRKRVFDIDMQHCPNCGAGEIKIIAAILERPAIDKILKHLGLQAQPPPRTPQAGLGPVLGYAEGG